AAILPTSVDGVSSGAGVGGGAPGPGAVVSGDVCGTGAAGAAAGEDGACAKARGEDEVKTPSTTAAAIFRTSRRRKRGTLPRRRSATVRKRAAASGIWKRSWRLVTSCSERGRRAARSIVVTTPSSSVRPGETTEKLPPVCAAMLFRRSGSGFERTGEPFSPDLY